MIDIRSYMVRAWRDWTIDNQLTPYIVVNCKFKGVQLPKSYHNQDSVTLNIANSALQNFKLTQDYIEFDARFDAQSHHLILPILSIHGIYAMENNHGMWFNIEKVEQKNTQIKSGFSLSD